MAITNTQITSTNITPVLENTAAIGGGGDIAVTIMILCNTTNSTDITVDIHVVAATEAAGDGNMIMKNLAIPAGESFSLDTEKFVLEENDSIQVISSAANAVTVTSSYVRV
jgi:hypothetical protein